MALSGLALFHPSLFFLTNLFGGGPWTRILHPFIGLVMFLSFLVLALRFWRDNLMHGNDWQWLKQWRDVINNREETLPEVGRYNAGQKMLFWVMIVCLATTAVDRVRHLAAVFCTRLQHHGGAYRRAAACARRIRTDPRHHRAHLRGDLGEGNGARNDSRLCHPHLGQETSPRLAKGGDRRWCCEIGAATTGYQGERRVDAACLRGIALLPVWTWRGE